MSMPAGGANAYLLGNTVTMVCTNNTLAIPVAASGLRLLVRQPPEAGTPQTITVSVSANGSGAPYGVFTPPVQGRYRYRFETIAGTPAAAENVFDVLQRQVEEP